MIIPAFDVNVGTRSAYFPLLQQTGLVALPVGFEGKETCIMKKKPIRVALWFATFTKDQLNSFAILVLACLKNNPLFPDLPVKHPDLQALVAAYQDKMTAAAQGGPIDTAAFYEASDALVAALRQIAAYIQSLGLTNVSGEVASPCCGGKAVIG
jgi:hypothetical protein